MPLEPTLTTTALLAPDYAGHKVPSHALLERWHAEDGHPGRRQDCTEPACRGEVDAWHDEHHAGVLDQCELQPCHAIARHRWPTSHDRSGRLVPGPPGIPFPMPALPRP